MKYSGRCLCGRVSYEADADPLVNLQCQCRDCQKRSGGGHASYLMFPKGAVSLAGPIKYHETSADSGNISTCGFCSECGSQIVSFSTGFPDAIGIFAGSLDEPARFKPELVVYASRGLPWDKVDPALPTFPVMPPMEAAQ